MLRTAQVLFFTSLRNKEHRRRQHAAAVFAVLWLLSVLFNITTNFLLISVQALVVLNIAASLIASVVTQSLCSRAGTLPNYPFVFGFYRLSTVVRLGGIIFLVFGCLTTIVESLHRGMHAHHSNPYFLLCMGALQLTFQLIYCREVRMTDRVTGHHGMAGAQSEDILHHACAAASSENRGALGGGDLFKPAADEQAFVASPTSSIGGGSGGVRNVQNKMTTMVLYLLCPVACVVVSVLLVITDSAVFDTMAALLLAAYYGYTGCQEGREMLDLLMNKCVTDLRRNRSLERCLRNVKMLDGVLQVQSTVWWNINEADSMLLIRIRLMSDSDACAVSQAVRRQLVNLATHVYVECFPANGTDGSLGEGSPLSWGTPTANDRHRSHTHSHGHSHNHAHGHKHKHSHKHSAEVEASFGNAARGSPTGALDAEAHYNASLPTSPGCSAAVSPNGVSSYAATNPSEWAATTAFPAPPLSALSPSTTANHHEGEHYSSRNPVASGDSGDGRSAYPALPPLATPSFPQAPYSVYSGGSGAAGDGSDGNVSYTPSCPPGGETRYGQPMLRNSALGSGSFPLPPSSARPGVVPPPVFTPFRPSAGVEDKRSASSSHEFV